MQELRWSKVHCKYSDTLGGVVFNCCHIVTVHVIHKER